MEAKIQSKNEKAIIAGQLHIYRKDLLRVISWYDFLPASEIKELDKNALDNLVKLINYITRNDD